ncbi:hypothetical protein [Polymorphospora sp. NPDC050346]|uniref:hypothetical protein n=1 Tax=Polymorphospora sp. NPDC050346 TaxID=3155780 RepID=UPI0033E0BCA9
MTDSTTPPRIWGGWTPRNRSWTLQPDSTPPGIPADGTSGPWRQDGRPMHGVYTRPAAAPLVNQVDQVAVINGRRCRAWRGPATLANWSHPLVSAWHPIIGQGHGRTGRRTWHDPDAWLRDAVLAGRKPGCYLEYDDDQARATTVLIAHNSLSLGVYRPAAGPLYLGSTCGLADLYGADRLTDLVGRYYDVLPADLWHTHVLPIGDHLDTRPIDVLPVFDELPLAVRGLVLGYPPVATAGWLLHQTHPWVELGSKPVRGWRAPAATGSLVAGGSRA